MKIPWNKTNVSLNIKAPSGSDPTDLDFTYTRTLSSSSAKVNAVLGTDTAHLDNSAVYVQPTNAPELLKIDFPDSAFAVGVPFVILTVFDPVKNWSRELRVELVDPVSFYLDGKVFYKEGAVNVNTELGVDGTVLNPVGSFAALKTLADLVAKKASIEGLLTITSTLTAYAFSSSVPGVLFDQFKLSRAQITLASNVSLNYCKLNNVEVVTGTSTFTETCQFDFCYISGIAGSKRLGGTYRNCIYSESHYTVIEETVLISPATIKGSELVFNFTGINQVLVVIKSSFNRVRISGMTSSEAVSLEMSSGTLEIDNTNTSGGVIVIGDPKITDNGNGSTLIKQGVGLNHWSGFPLADGANMVEGDGSGNSRFTEKALEKAPTGGDATEANQNTLIAGQTVINDNVLINTAKLNSIISSLGGVLQANIVQMNGFADADGVSYNKTMQLVNAMVNGRFKIDEPSVGQTTFYKRDDTSVLTVVSTSDVERTRIV